ncbi:MAG: hypothetical protein ACT4QC_23725 [Planctomycetaceae bacterium]
MQIVCAAFLLALGCGAHFAAAAERPFRILVVDDRTGRGVPLVQLETVNNIRFYTDSNGVAAIDDIGLAGLTVYFHVKSHGYTFPKDGFGNSGKAFQVRPGGEGKLEITRVNIAERLYRVTGGDIYRDSVLTGVPQPLNEPLLNAKVLGSDSVLTAVYKGKVFWFWGDTNQPAYPLGLFHVPGATSQLPAVGGLDPAVGVNLRYFTGEDGFVRAMANMPGSGPTWIGGLAVVPDETGHERMFAEYAKIEPPLRTYQRGLVVYDDASNSLQKVTEFPVEAPLLPGGHPFRLADGRADYVYFAKPFPLTRVPARDAALARLGEYEGYTCLCEGSTLDEPNLDRTPDGTLRWGWKKNTPTPDRYERRGLRRSDPLKPYEHLIQLRDRDTGKPVRPHHGSVCWNDFRKRFILIDCEGGGTSPLGETWYAEADSPVGPWVYAVKIVTHDKYSFYNPKQHPMFDADGGRLIYFEGSYSHTFSGNNEQTPRYDYNQIMYRLDLSDPRLALPVAIYRAADGSDTIYSPRRSASAAQAAAPFDMSQLAFFAYDRPQENLVAVYAGKSPQGRPLLTLDSGSSAGQQSVAFYALPAEATSPPEASAPLYEFTHPDGRREYSTASEPQPEGFARAKQPLCRVWKNPYRSNP